MPRKRAFGQSPAALQRARRVWPYGSVVRPIIDLPQQLFGPADVPAIFADVDLTPECDHAKLAASLDTGIRLALTRKRAADRQLAATDEAEALEEVAERTEALLNALGFDTAPLATGGTLRCGESGGQFLVSLSGQIAFETWRTETTDDEDAALDRREAELLTETPALLSVIARRARQAASELRKKARRGRRMNVFERCLSGTWVIAYRTATGSLPRYRSSNGPSPDVRITDMFSRFLKIAAERLTTSGKEAAAVSALRAFADLSPRSLANIIEETLRPTRDLETKFRALSVAVAPPPET